MPAYPRPDTPATDAPSEGAAWAKAMTRAVPDPDAGPLTPEEKGQLRDMMIEAAEAGDKEMLNQLGQLANNPAAFRRELAAVK